MVEKQPQMRKHDCGFELPSSHGLVIRIEDVGYTVCDVVFREVYGEASGEQDGVVKWFMVMYHSVKPRLRFGLVDGTDEVVARGAINVFHRRDSNNHILENCTPNPVVI